MSKRYGRVLAVVVCLLGHASVVAQPVVKGAQRPSSSETNAGTTSASRSMTGGMRLAQAAPVPHLAPQLVPPSLLSGVATTAAPAPMSIWRKLGFGLVLTGPALVGTGVILGAKQKDQAKAVDTFFCGGSCTPKRDFFDKLASAAPWLLVGAGAAALFSGGVLLWSTRVSKRVHLGVAMRSGAPVALLKGTF
jgi:hypothetical protein